MFLAHDPSRDRPVALKLFTLDLRPERVQQLIAEFQRLIAAELYHPALNTPLATGLADGSAYLVYDYVDAQSVDLAIREFGPAPPAHAVRVCAQLAGALDYAATVNVHHGAMHPRDVLLSATEIRLTGIGVSRALEAVGVAPPVRRPYSAPEIIAGAEWDRRADVFSLATVVHELLWGRRVSGVGGDIAATLGAIAGGDLPQLQAAFVRALAQDPQERYPTALAFAEALTKALPDITSEAAPAPPPAESAASARRDTQPAAAAPLLPLDDAIAASEGERDVSAPPPVPVADSQAIAPPRSVAASAAPSEPADLQLITAEEERYRDVEATPSIVEPAVETSLPLPMQPAMVETPRVERREQPSMTLPIAAALVIGVGLGFFGGYGAKWRSSDAAPAETVAAAPNTAPPAATEPPRTATPPREPAREFTETAVAPAAPASAASAAAPPSNGAAATPPADRRAEPDTRSDATSAGAGRILVRSTPAGARVVVDGRDYGLSPVAVRDLATGSHRVRVTQDGFLPVERRVSVTASQPAQSLTIPLQRVGVASDAAESPRPVTTDGVERFVGTLVVDSRPAGAKVFLDGRAVGNTPLSMRDVRAGEHAVRLEHDGYRRWSGSIRVVAAERNRVTASLER